MKTKIQIGKTNYPDGTKKIKARVKEIGTASSGDVLKFEKQFHELRDKLKKQLTVTDKKSGNAVNHWILGDLVIHFYEYAEKNGFDFKVNTQPLVNYVGKTESFWMLHKKFRKIYPSKDLINPKIPWKMYLYLIRVEDDDKRKLLEKMILDGAVDNQLQLRKFKGFTIEQIKKNKKVTNKSFSNAQQKVYGALKKRDLTKEELVKITGLSWDGIRGRISELRNQFDCNIYIVGDRYHLGTNDKN